jgi:hypothetical protein
MESPNVLHMLRESDLYMLETRQATLVKNLCHKLLDAVRALSSPSSPSSTPHTSSGHRSYPQPTS